MNAINRNKPILIIGLITTIAFVVIIILGQTNDSGVTLTEVIQSRFSVEDRPLPSLPEPVDKPIPQTQGALPQEQVLFPQPEVPVVILDAKEITFTEEGFRPSSTQAVQGQIVRWINNTDRPITIRELLSQHEEFRVGVVIPASETYELTLSGSGFWTFKEIESGHIGKILIAKRSSKD